MSVQTDLEARAAKLRAILEDSNAALEEKGGTPADDLAGLPSAIEDLESGVELDVLEIEPTGEEIVVDAEEGRAFRRVIVAAVGGGSEYPALVLPEEYVAYVDHARANLYTGDFAALMVLERDDWLVVAFLMDDFEIVTFDDITTEFTASGWFTCGYTKSTGEWATYDYRSEVSTGGNYARHIQFASCYIVKGSQTLFPCGIYQQVQISNIDWSNYDTNKTCVVTLATGGTVTYTMTLDAEGNLVKVEGSNGQTVEVS